MDKTKLQKLDVTSIDKVANYFAKEEGCEVITIAHDGTEEVFYNTGNTVYLNLDLLLDNGCPLCQKELQDNCCLTCGYEFVRELDK